MAPMSGPQRYFEDRIRWRPLEIAFWLATVLPFAFTPSYLVLASQIAITALFALSLDLILGYAGKAHWLESDFQLVTINGAPGLLMRHPIAGDGTYSFDITDGRIRAIYVVRNPDKLRGFLERTQ